MRLITAAEILIDKIKRDYKDDVAVVVMMGSHLYGETHRLSDLDLYFVVNTPRGFELGRTFIIEGIGFDFWPISWDRMERIANHDERITAIITEGKVLYYGSVEDLNRFNALKEKALDVTDVRKFAHKAKAVMNGAYKAYFELEISSDLTSVRKHALGVSFAVTNAIALINCDTVKRGRGKLKAELLAMPHVPVGFEAHYDVLFESTDVHAIKNAAKQLILETDHLIEQVRRAYDHDHPEKVTEKLAGLYEELINFYNKIEHGIAVNDYVTVFYAANEIVIELEDVFSGTGILLSALPDIVGLFDLNDMEAYGMYVKEHQKLLVDLLKENGVEINVYQDFDELKRVIG